MLYEVITYYVKGAVIGDPKDVDDPLQAIRVIQLKPGADEVLVISSFDKQGETSLETWFGIELPSFAPGTYDLADARKISFYRRITSYNVCYMKLLRARNKGIDFQQLGK